MATRLRQSYSRVGGQVQRTNCLFLNGGDENVPFGDQDQQTGFGFTAATITRCWFQICFQDNLIIWRECVETAVKKPESRICHARSSAMIMF